MTCGQRIVRAAVTCDKEPLSPDGLTELNALIPFPRLAIERNAHAANRDARL
jgi:hypothetical protein